jgi:4-carboxymuconolactone decarboxylase
MSSCISVKINFDDPQNQLSDLPQERILDDRPPNYRLSLGQSGLKLATTCANADPWRNAKARGARMTTNKKTFDTGLKVRREMFGPAGAEKQIAAATKFTAPMQDLVTRYCFGEVWERPHLDRKTRSLLTLAILTTLGRSPQVKTHVRGAVANGATMEEIREVLLHTMIYAGVPAGVEAFTQAAEVLKDLGLEE